jgi:hypothetical protein
MHPSVMPLLVASQCIPQAKDEGRVFCLPACCCCCCVLLLLQLWDEAIWINQAFFSQVNYW